MDINEAALRLKVIESVNDQINHLQMEASASSDCEYSQHCNELAQDLLMKLMDLVEKPVQKVENNVDTTAQVS